MTDRERYLSFLHSLGFKENPDGDRAIYSLAADEYIVYDGGIYLGAGAGYASYFHWFKFDADGKYLEHGAGE